MRASLAPSASRANAHAELTGRRSSSVSSNVMVRPTWKSSRTAPSQRYKGSFAVGAEADPAGLVSPSSSTPLVVKVAEHPQCFFWSSRHPSPTANFFLEALVLKFEAFYFFLLSREPSLGAGRTLIKASEPARRTPSATVGAGCCTGFPDAAEGRAHHARTSRLRLESRACTR